MYSKILVPLDGSTLSEGILPYVRSFARVVHVSVELLHVDDPAQPRAYVPAMQVEYLEKIAASFSGITDVKLTMELGNPADMIVDRVAGQPDTLIAMATHGLFRDAALASRKRCREGFTWRDKPFAACAARRRGYQWRSPLEHGPGTAGRFRVGRGGVVDGYQPGCLFEVRSRLGACPGPFLFRVAGRISPYVWSAISRTRKSSGHRPAPRPATTW